MRQLIILFAMTLNFLAYSQSGWSSLPSGVNSFLWGISFADLNTGYIASDGGKILKTTSAGSVWIVQNLSPAVDLNSVNFIDALTGYTSGSQGKIFKTTNGGANWITTNSPVAGFISSLEFLDVNSGFIGTNDGQIHKTTDGGTSWVQYGQGVISSAVMEFSFPEASTGYATLYEGKVAKTTNKGVNWQIQNTGLNISENLFGICFIDTLNGFAASSVGKIIKTTNGGINWITVYNSPGNPVVDVFFTSQIEGYAIGGGQQSSMVVLKTTNAGISWNIETLAPSGHANCIFFTSPNEGFISCEGGVIYKTTNGGNTIGINQISSSIAENFSLEQNYPNPFNPQTYIEFNIPAEGFVTLKIFDCLGAEIEELVNSNLKPGLYKTDWNAFAYPSGVYFYNLVYGNTSATKKMVLVK